MNRRDIAQRALKAIEEGNYTNSAGKRVEIAKAMEAAKAGSFIVWADSPLEPPFPATNRPDLQIYPATTLEAAHRQARQGERKIAVLNFASAKNPGGGFLNGSQAQEESIARSSGMYACLERCMEFYHFHRRQADLFYSDSLIWSPGVPVIFDDAGAPLDESHLVDIITMPAVNAGAVRKNNPERADQIEAAMHRRIGRLMDFCATRDIEVLILGAWGCGVFGNDPAMIARLFKEVIGDRPWPFRQIDFAIHDPRPGQPAAEYFAAILKS